MIVKLWPVRGKRGAKDCVDYVRDDAKVTVISMDEHGNLVAKVIERKVADEDIQGMDDVIAYVSNTEKTTDDERSYVSGYQCHPDHVLEQFDQTRQALGVFETGPDDILCYHMVQSFPKGLDISPELAHQCGLELLQKLGAHQGIVCTHVNPVADEDGQLHGEQIHNHIVFNAYKLPEFIDPEHPKQIKFNRCNDTYKQLQVWNDEIAMDHGLPIVAEIDVNNIYSWEPDAKNKTNDWRDRMRYDIKQARHKAKNWDDFLKRMTAAGYSVRDGKTLTYHAPDGKHSARGTSLGKEYTKNGLLMFWALRLQQQKAVSIAARNGEASPFRQAYNSADTDLYIKIPIADSDSIYQLPIGSKQLSPEAIDSYFVEGGLYEVVDGAGQKVYTATGDEAKALLMELERERGQGIGKDEEVKRRVRAIEKSQREAMRDYEQNAKASRSPYSTFFWNEDGTRKNTLELSFVLASLLIGEHFGVQNQYTEAAQQIAEQRHARDLRRQAGPDKRLQMMMDSLAVVKQEGFQSAEDLNKAVNAAGKNYNRAKKALTNTKIRIEKLEPLLRAFEDYEDTAEVVAMVQAMDDGPEKDALKAGHAETFAKYNAAKRVMYGFKTSPNAIGDTRERYQKMKASIPSLEEKFDAARAELRRMKRTQYAFQLSHSAEYLAGQETDTIRGPEKDAPERKAPERRDGRDTGRE